MRQRTHSRTKKIEEAGSCKIHGVDVTNDTLTGRGGLALFARYLEGIDIFSLLLGTFNGLRKSSKGLPVWNLFKQVFVWFCDGTSRHLKYFDHLKKDEGYAAVIEARPASMASSHQVKRFFRLFSLVCAGAFRRILKRLFLWRLHIERPGVIELYIDTMVMDNDDAKRRHGVEPTYKKVTGFQPLQIIWNGKVVDALFRGGKKHGNSGKTAVNMVAGLVNLIRKEYRPDVAIIVRMDSAFLDQDNLAAFDALDIGFICSGKMYSGIMEYAHDLPDSAWRTYDRGRFAWEYFEWGFRYDSWRKHYRAVYTRPVYEEGQALLEFARPESVMLTNIGVNDRVLESLDPKRAAEPAKAEWIIESHHRCGADELAHRGLKDFGFEEMPFKRFAANTAFYYCMLISFFLFETFKEDVLSGVVPVKSYATTVRRKALDFAAKIVRTGGGITLKVTRAVMESLRFDKLWERSLDPPPIMAW